MRFGFAVKVLGEGGLPDCDARRPQNAPHLRHSLAYVDAILDYCDRADLRMYRLSSDLAPYLTHPEMPAFHRQLDECGAELAALGAKARAYDIRLSLHPSQYIVLNAQDESVAAKSLADLNAQAELLERMGLGDEGVVVTHVGGAYGDPDAGIARFARRFALLSPVAQRRLVVENDDRTFGIDAALRCHALCGIRVVFDILHHFCLNPTGLPVREAVARSLDTWAGRGVPKIHYSTPRTEAMEEARKSGKASAMRGYGRAPDPRLHSDYINAFEFAYFLHVCAALDFDVMFECKAKDLAVLRLREDLVRFVGVAGERPFAVESGLRGSAVGKGGRNAGKRGGSSVGAGSDSGAYSSASGQRGAGADLGGSAADLV